MYIALESLCGRSVHISFFTIGANPRFASTMHRHQACYHLLRLLRNHTTTHNAQVLTRRQPYEGRNFMGVSMAVLEGQRPQVHRLSYIHTHTHTCYHPKAKISKQHYKIHKYIPYQVPSECPKQFEKLMRKCWHPAVAKRPTMRAVADGLWKMIKEDEDEEKDEV